MRKFRSFADGFAIGSADAQLSFALVAKMGRERNGGFGTTSRKSGRSMSAGQTA
jgi:hypothetical protein